MEEVEVEPDGEWHTEDNKYGSPGWLASHPPKGSAPKAPLPGPSRSQAPAVIKTDMNGSGARSVLQRLDDVVILDDSDDEEGLVKKEQSPIDYVASSGTSNFTIHDLQPFRLPRQTVIDLTLDSDDEDPLPPPLPPTNKRAEKRKADDSMNGRIDDAMKRQRTADLPNRPARRESSGHLNGGGAGVPPANPSSSSSWNGSSRSPNLTPSSHLPSQRPLPPNRAPSYDRPPPGLAVHDVYRPRPVTDVYSYSNGAYRATNGNGLPYNMPPPANDARRLPPPAPSAYSNPSPYLPRGSGDQVARWP